jgi:hypothetical protein
LVCALGAVGSALGENHITVWYATGTYDLYQSPPRVVITSAGTFKIQATGDYNGLGDIRSVTVASNVTGAVDVSILRRPEEGGGPGAHDVKVLDLSGGQATTTIVEAQVAHDLGYSGATQATQAGTLTIGHDVLSNIEITQDIGGLTVRGTLSADVSCHTLGVTLVTRLNGGSLVCGDLGGHLTIGDSTHVSHSGNVSINGGGGLSKHIYVYGSLTGCISLEKGMSDLGRIETTGGLGSIISHGLLYSGNPVIVGGDLGSLSVTGIMVGLHADVEVTGNLGTLDVGGEIASHVHITGNADFIHTDGPLSGYVEVGGTVNQLEIFGDLTGTFWGSGDVNSASVLRVRETGRLHSETLLNSATIWTY